MKMPSEKRGEGFRRAALASIGGVVLIMCGIGGTGFHYRSELLDYTLDHLGAPIYIGIFEDHTPFLTTALRYNTENRPGMRYVTIGGSLNILGLEFETSMVASDTNGTEHYALGGRAPIVGVRSFGVEISGE